MRTLWLGAVIVLCAAPQAGATITGFTGGTLNGSGGSVGATSLVVSNNTGNDTDTWFYNTKQTVTNGFTTSFIYQVTGSQVSDGATFMIQDSGINALGGGSCGSCLGYSGISPSIAIEWHFINSDLGTNLAYNGSYGSYISESPIVINNGDNILVTLTYSGTSLTQTEVDQSTLATFTHTYTGVNLLSTLGATTAWVGFSGGTGGGTSIQTFSSFTFTPTVIPAPAPIAVIAAAMLGLKRRRWSSPPRLPAQ